MCGKYFRIERTPEYPQGTVFLWPSAEGLAALQTFLYLGERPLSKPSPKQPLVRAASWARPAQPARLGRPFSERWKVGDRFTRDLFVRMHKKSCMEISWGLSIVYYLCMFVYICI